MIVIDTSHLANRLVHASSDTIKREPEYLSHLLFTSVLMNAKKFAASKTNPIVMALDKKPYWRHDYFRENIGRFVDLGANPKAAEYKGGRTKDSDIPWDKIYEVLDDCLETITNHSDFHVVGVRGAEADDVIAVACRYAVSIGQEVDVVSSDKDFQQLHRPDIGVRVWDPMKKAYRPVLDVELVKRLHAISGDGGDNVPPIKRGAGEGSKTAQRIAEDLDSHLKPDPVLRERYEFNRKLTDLDLVPPELEAKIISELKKHDHAYNATALLKVFSKYRLNAIGGRVDEFKLRDSVAKKPSYTEASKKIDTVHENTLENFFA